LGRVTRANLSIFLVWLVIVVLTVSLLLSLWDAHRRAEDRARASALTYARMIADHAAGTFQLVDLTLVHLISHISAADIAQAHTMAEPVRNRLQAMMRESQSQAPGVVSMSLTDDQGYVFANTVGTPPGSQLGDRPYFLQLKRQDDDRPAISEAIKGRVSNKWGVQFARRVVDDRGRFLGMVVANIGLDDYFGAYYASLEAEAGTSFSLWSAGERTLLVRYPPVEDRNGRALSTGPSEPLRRASEAVEGTAIGASSIDGVVKAFGVHKLQRYPVHAVAALAEDNYLRDWHQSAVKAALGIAVLILGGVVQTFLALRSRRADRALAASEEKLRSLFELSPLGIARNDMEGRFIEANSACLDIVGYSLEELQSLSYWAVTPERFAEQEQAQLDQLRTSGRYGPYEKEYIHKSGQPVPVRLNGMLIVGGDRRTYIWSIIEDITSQVASERALVERAQQLARSNADLEQFAYVASHDLQTPLRNVTSYSQLLARRYRGKLDEDADEFIGFIVDSARHMSRLINDLLGYSRVVSRSHGLEAVVARHALDLALSNLALQIQDAAAEITVGDLPLVMAEESLLVSLFQNLVGNAIKYRHPDRVVRISVVAERLESEYWRLTVRDNGVGIHEEYFDKIFEIFQRLFPQEDRDGTGIGLALCQRIVNRCGGNMWVESTVGEGAAFHFTLLDGGTSPSQDPDV